MAVNFFGGTFKLSNTELIQKFQSNWKIIKKKQKPTIPGTKEGRKIKKLKIDGSETSYSKAH